MGNFVGYGNKKESVGLPTNPFVVTGEIPDAYFCDRAEETEMLVSTIVNGNNVVLVSPRRMGKTSLVEHCYNRPQIRDNFYTFYIDILPTTSLAEFVALVGKQIYDSLVPRGEKAVKGFLAFLTSLRGSVGYDVVSGIPSFSVSIGSVANPILTLDEIFRYLANADRPCIVTIDEFQQISKYPEKNVEALLRSHIQKIRNCNFIFAGSERHLMINMFQDSARPFYGSATMMDLRAIPLDVYCDFIVRLFSEEGKSIATEQARYIYELLGGNTFYIQRLCNASFAKTPVGAECTHEIIEEALEQQLRFNSSFFAERLSLLSPKLKPLLYAIAADGEGRSILSAEFISRHKLGTSSAVQYAAKQLVEQGLLNHYDSTYTPVDRFLSLWIKRTLL